MELMDIIETLETSNLTREVREYYGDVISYTNNTGTDITVTVNETSYPKLIKICILPEAIYVNNYKENNYTKYNLTDITTITMT